MQIYIYIYEYNVLYIYIIMPYHIDHICSVTYLMYIIRYIYISYVQGTFRKGEAPLGVEDESGEDEEMSCFLG